MGESLANAGNGSPQGVGPYSGVDYRNGSDIQSDASLPDPREQARFTGAAAQAVAPLTFAQDHAMRSAASQGYIAGRLNGTLTGADLPGLLIDPDFRTSERAYARATDTGAVRSMPSFVRSPAREARQQDAREIAREQFLSDAPRIQAQAAALAFAPLTMHSTPSLMEQRMDGVATFLEHSPGWQQQQLQIVQGPYAESVDHSAIDAQRARARNNLAIQLGGPVFAGIGAAADVLGAPPQFVDGFLQAQSGLAMSSMLPESRGMAPSLTVSQE